MNIFRRIYESFFKKGQTQIASNIIRSYGDLSSNDLMELLNSIKQVSQERQTRLTEYRQMLSDGITLSAIELMAEDATQPDPITNKSIWVTCPNYPQLEKEINNFLQNNLNAETTLYAIAFNIAAFGDAYLSTFYSDPGYKKSGNRIGDYFEIETSEFITHLYHYGKPSGFLTTKNPQSARYQQDNQIILDEKDFIHFTADNGLNYAKIQLQTQDNNNNQITQEYTIKYGNSFLEAARANYKTLGLFKDLMMLARLTRSQFYRLVSIDVGQADDRETTRMIKEVRDVISNSQTIQPHQSINTLSAPLSTGGNVYFPTRNGKGSVSMETVGGDFNVSEMADLNYFDDQYYGSLKVPKQFLGQAEELPSGIGESSLTRLDIRYARTIKRLQKAIKEGINKLIIWKFQIDNFNSQLNIIPEYTIHMHQVSSAESIEQAEALDQESNKIEKLLDILERIDQDNNINKLELMPYLLDNLSLQPQLNKLLKDNINKLLLPTTTQSSNNNQQQSLQDNFNHYNKQQYNYNKNNNLNELKSLIHSNRIKQQDDNDNNQQLIINNH